MVLLRSFPLSSEARRVAVVFRKHRVGWMLWGAKMGFRDRSCAHVVWGRRVEAGIAAVTCHGMHTRIDWSVDESSRVHASVKLGSFTTVLEGVKIEEGCSIGSGCVIGPDVVIGRDCVVGSNCTVCNASLGERVVLLPGVRIGQDGFGFIPTSKADVPVVKKPQLLRVIIGDDVEIGANSTVDRGSWRDTTIGAFCKLDNLVQVAHNVVLGRACIMAAQSGIAGSTTVGDGVMIGGQVGIAQHLKIGDRVMIAGKSGVMTDLDGGASYGGCPAMPARQWHRQTLHLKKASSEERDKPKSREGKA